MSIPRSFFGTITSQISLYMVSHKIWHSGGGQQSWAVLQRITILAMHIGMASSMQCYDGVVMSQSFLDICLWQPDGHTLKSRLFIKQEILEGFWNKVWYHVGEWVRVSLPWWYKYDVEHKHKQACVLTICVIWSMKSKVVAETTTITQTSKAVYLALSR
jgi:hypothetical protein